jgi:hypothetical protein
MDRETWFAQPWYEAQVLLDGLRDEGILGDGTGDNGHPPMTPPTPRKESIDVANADLGELSFLQTRRAG